MAKEFGLDTFGDVTVDAAGERLSYCLLYTSDAADE